MRVVQSSHVVRVMTAALEAAALAKDVDTVVILLLAAYHDILEGEAEYE